MEPAHFIAEVYRRMDMRFGVDGPTRKWSDVENDPSVTQAVVVYKDLLPSDSGAAILDIGFGEGWFMGACIRLGYTDIEGADFGATERQDILNWSPSVRQIHDITDDIGGFLADKTERYDFIHLSHVIEHIPKHSLFYNVDALYQALKPGGKLLVRTPNMEGPRPLSSLFVTLGHEYGFTGSNLQSLLQICNFDEVHILNLLPPPKSVRQKIVRVARSLVLGWNRLMHRMFGAWSVGGQYGEELNAIAQRLDRPALFDTATR